MKRKKRNLVLMILICFALAGCGDLNNGTAADPQTDQVPTVTPTSGAPFVYGKISPCLADAGSGSNDDGKERGDGYYEKKSCFAHMYCASVSHWLSEC